MSGMDSIYKHFFDPGEIGCAFHRAGNWNSSGMIFAIFIKGRYRDYLLYPEYPVNPACPVKPFFLFNWGRNSFFR